MRIRAFVLAVAAGAALAGCGNNLGEQALIGAGAGALTAAVVDGDIGLGAVVGGAGNVAYCQAYPQNCRR